LLIVAAVFSVAALLATTVFSNVQTTQRQVQGQQRTSTDGRYILETIARSIRTGTLNYSISDSGYSVFGEVITNPVTQISTVDQAGVVTCYKRDTDQVKVLTPAPADCDLGDPNWTSFTPGDLTVDALSFYVTPRSDPYRPVPRSATDCAVERTPASPATPVTAGFDSAKGACICTSNTQCFADQSCVEADTASICANPNTQPQVTIYLKTSSTNTAPGERASVTFQTTIVSRLYQR
ncbi:MAG: hypothetical protein AAB619_03935, partial [Patescibacteria group bacterium]